MTDRMTVVQAGLSLLLALFVDYTSFGPNSWRDRVAFLMALPAIKRLFDGSTLDLYTVQKIADWLRAGLEESTNQSYTPSDINAIIGALVGLSFLYCVGCLLPPKFFPKKLGSFVTLAFRQSPQGRINVQLWAFAVFIGMTSELPNGAVGVAVDGTVNICATINMFLTAWMFGAM